MGVGGGVSWSQWATPEQWVGRLSATVTARAAGMADCANFWARSRGSRTVRSVSVAGSVVADMTAYLRLHGVDADAVLRRAGIEPRTNANAADRIPGHAMAALWREALAASGDLDLGLHAGVAFQPGALDIVGYVMLSSHTAREALRRGARLMRLLNDGLELDIESGPLVTTCRLRIRDVSDTFLQRDPRQVVETALVGVVHQLRLLTGRPVIARAVTMRHAAPSSGATEHARLFGVAPTFGAAEDTVVLDNRDLDVTLRSANPLLLTAFETHADAALAALDANETLAGRVVREIVQQLKGEAPTMPQVAKALAISPRHLQRGLAAEGTTFQSLLDDARRELSVRHLSAPNATVASVAWLVGFSEPSAFHRAFRRWTGHSPRAMAMPAH